MCGVAQFMYTLWTPMVRPPRGLPLAVVTPTPHSSPLTYAMFFEGNLP